MNVQREGGPRQFSVGKEVLFCIIIIVAFLLTAEGAIRIWALFLRTPHERYNTSTRRLELVPNLRYANSRGEEFRINSRGFVGPDFDQFPADDVYRIIAVGDSCTFSNGFWQLAYPGIVERYLNKAAGRKRFEVINAGIEGYNSTFARQRITEELIGYRPHLVIIYVGWNDLMKIDPRNASAVGRYATLAALMEQSYLVRAYRKLLFVHLRPLVFQPKVSMNEADLRTYERFVPRIYEENLREIVQVLRQRGVRSLLLTLPTVIRPGMTRKDIEAERVFFPYFAGTYSVGEFLSLHLAYNRVVRGVAATAEVPMVDLDELFNGRDKRSLFWDTMHPSTAGHCVIADALYRHMAREFKLISEVPGDDQGICR